MRLTSNDITKPLEKIAGRGHNFSRVFSDWLTISCCALTDRQQEALYLDTLKPYRDERAKGERNADLFAHAFGEWAKACAIDEKDYLGDIFQERVTRGENGQFFTPESVCKLMAQITAPDLKPGQTVLDPTCGSGRTLIAAAEICRDAHFTGVDLDANCMRMTAMNMAAYGMQGFSIQADSLRLKAVTGYEMRRLPWGVRLRPIEQQEAQEIIEGPFKRTMEEGPRQQQQAPAEAVPVEALTQDNDNQPQRRKPEQFSLFGPDEPVTPPRRVRR